MIYYTSKSLISPNSLEVKNSYKPFRPYKLNDSQKEHLVRNYEKFLSVQDGKDIDDYEISDDNKWERYLSGYKRGDLLLVGVGSGREIVLCKELGFEVVGITLGSRNIDFGREFFGLGKDEFIETTADCMPFEDDYFDIVGAFQTFEHTVSPSLFLCEQSRVLKQGGTILLEWPPPKKFTGGSHGHHQICLFPGQAKALLEKNGFGKVELFYHDMLPIPESEYWTDSQPAVKPKMLFAKGIKL